MNIQRLQVSSANQARPLPICFPILKLQYFMNNIVDSTPITTIQENTSMLYSISDATLIGASITYLAGLFLLLSFAGPYWIESYPEMFSSFKRMGLWEYCFDRFRFPAYQFDKLFDGCHYIFSEVSITLLS